MGIVELHLRIDKYLSQLSPRMAEKESAILLKEAKQHLIELYGQLYPGKKKKTKLPPNASAKGPGGSLPGPA